MMASKRKNLSQRQVETLRTVAAGECVNPGFGNSNVDNRSFFSLHERGLVDYVAENRDPSRGDVRTGRAWATPAGMEALRRHDG